MPDSLLDNVDIDALLKKALAQYTQNEGDPWRSGLSTMGLAMLAGSQQGGNIWSSLGKGGLLGMEAMQAEKTRQQKDPAQLVSLLTAVDAMKQKQLERQSLLNFQKRMGGGGGPAPAGYGPPAQFQPAPLSADMPQQGYGMNSRDEADLSQGPPPPQGGYMGSMVTPPTAGLPTGAPTAPPQGVGRAQDNLTYKAMLEAQADPYSATVRDIAKNWIAEFHKNQPKLKETKTLMTPDKQRVTVNIFDDGRTEVVPFLPDPEKLHWIDKGNGFVGLDPITGQQMTSLLPKTATPGEIMTDIRARSEGNLNRAQSAQIARDQLNKPQLVEGGEGYVAVNPNQPGVTRPVMGPDGQQLQKGQDMPSQFMTVKVSNTQLGNKLNFASRLLKGEKIGEVQGDKDALLPIYGALPGAQDAAAYYKPEGIATRAAIADIGSQILLLRSGAAVSLDEYKRSKDFIPKITDSPKAVHDKIAYLQQIIKEENDAVDAVAKSMGFRTPRGLAPATAAPAAPPAAPVTDSVDKLTREKLRRQREGQ